MLGSTFNAVFELQMENLQNGDRFYYLTRTQGLNFLNELEKNSFSKLIMENTDLARQGATASAARPTTSSRAISASTPSPRTTTSSRSIQAEQADYDRTIRP